MLLLVFGVFFMVVMVYFMVVFFFESLNYIINKIMGNDINIIIFYMLSKGYYKFMILFGFLVDNFIMCVLVIFV